MKIVYLLLCVKIFLLTTAIPISEDETKSTINDLEADRTYQVTEDVDDIPDTRPKQPIIANYTIQRPLNLAKTNDSIKFVEKSNKFSLIQIHSESSDKSENEDLFSQFHENTTDFFSGIKTHYKLFKNSVINGFKNWFRDTIDKLKK